MAEVLAASLVFPAVLFTVLLALALLYWLFVLVGALDLDLLGGAHGGAGSGLEGAAKGALEGAAKGALEGAAKGALEGAAKGAAEGLADGVHGPHGVSSLLSALSLHRVPATVALTLIAAFGWFTSVLGTLLAEPLWAGLGLPRWTLGLAVLVGSLAAALLLTSLAVRPLAPLFVTRHATSKKDLVGRVCVISTGRVDERFGQAVIDEGGASHILDVRCDTPGALRRGDLALLVSWNPEEGTFGVEPLDPLLGRPSAAGTRIAPVVNDARTAGISPDGSDEESPPAAYAGDVRQRDR